MRPPHALRTTCESRPLLKIMLLLMLYFHETTRTVCFLKVLPRAAEKCPPLRKMFANALPSKFSAVIVTSIYVSIVRMGWRMTGQFKHRARIHPADGTRSERPYQYEGYPVDGLISLHTTISLLKIIVVVLSQNNGRGVSTSSTPKTQTGVARVHPLGVRSPHHCQGREVFLPEGPRTQICMQNLKFGFSVGPFDFVAWTFGE